MWRNALERKIRKKGKNTTAKLSKRYDRLNNVIEDIGFYVFTYDDKEAIKDKTKTKENSLVISCDLPFDFDTRGERFKYPLFSKKADEGTTTQSA